LFSFLFVLVVLALSIIWVLSRGPSPTAQRLFVLTVKETSAIGFLANIFLTDAEVEEIMMFRDYDGDDFEMTDPTMITISAPGSVRPDNLYIYADTNNTTDTGNINNNTDFVDDGDDSGIELHELRHGNIRGYMMIVHDPLRLFIGTPNNFGGQGVTLANLIRNTGAVAGINAGGFNDPEGRGAGGTPEGLVITDGEVRWTTGGGWWGDSVVGFDSSGILHVGSFSVDQAVELDLQWAVNFGPALIINGIVQQRGPSGLAARTAIGQRADGAVLLLVLEGRQVDTLGATFQDMQRIFLEFDAINACNLDGGSSTMMIYNGDLLIRSASIYGPRQLATSFLVRDLG
jgi:exopolysaccharide biosynthesis protein